MHASEDARKQINGWVEEKTEGECFAECPVVFNGSQGLAKQLSQDIILRIKKTPNIMYQTEQELNHLLYCVSIT